MPLSDRCTAELDRLVATTQREGRVPSLVAGVVRAGTLAWSGGAGLVGTNPPDANTQYRMGSITKTFVAVAVMRLRDAGRLELTDRFEAHVPGTALGEVTIEQLLTHTSGTQAETPEPWWERTPGVSWEELSGGVGQRFRAGRRFHYTNVGYAALGRLLEVAHGRDWFEVLRDEVLEPLGMNRTSTRPQAPHAQGLAVHPFADVVLPEPEHDAGAMAPAGQLWSTVSDLSRWAAFLAGHTQGVLSADTLAEMREPHQVDDTPGAPWTQCHGLGFAVYNIDGVRYAGHGGSMPGFLAGLRVRLDSGDGAIVMLNATSAPQARGLIGSVLSTVAELDPPVIAPWTPSGDAAMLDILGTWHWGPAALTARFVDGHFVLGEPGAARGSRFAPTGPDRFVGLDGYYAGEPMEVRRRPDGSVSHLDIASFRFTRTPYDPDADIPGGVDPVGWR